MFETLVLIGVACIIGAVVGGGLKLVNVELPLIDSLARQLLLGVVGIVIIVVAVATKPAGGNGNGGTGPPDLGEAALTLSRVAGPPGMSLTVGGTGFASGETVAVRFHVQDIGEVTADGSGSFAGMTIVIPTNWVFEGQFQVVATGSSSSKSASQSFEVPRPTLELSPTDGPAGTQVTVTGSGFAVAEEIEVEFNLDRLAVVQADGEGRFSATVIIPADWPFSGEFDVRATGETSRRTKNAPFDVQ